MSELDLKPPVRQTRTSLFRTQTRSSPINLPPSPSPTDSESESQKRNGTARPQRSCSVNHTVHKTFLEPICDDCLLAELGVSALRSNQDPEQPTEETHHSFHDKLIWESDVKIEVDHDGRQANREIDSIGHNHLLSEDTIILESNVEVRVSDVSSSSNLPIASQGLKPTPASSTPSFGDADSESSKPGARTRGRARSRTKQLRRMAIDVSREDLRLRISSRLPSFQREGLQHFKDELKRGRCDQTETRPGATESPTRATSQLPKNLVKRFTDAHGDTWLKAKDAAQELGRKMSRKSRSPRRVTRPRDTMTFGRHGQLIDNGDEKIVPLAKTSPGENLSCALSLQPPPRGDDVAPKSFNMHHNNPVARETNSSTDPDILSTSPNSVKTSVDSWQTHLAQDLTTPRLRKHVLVLPVPGTTTPAPLLNGRAKPLLDLPIDTYPSTSTSATAVSTSITSHHWRSLPSNGSNPFSHDSYEYSSASNPDTSSSKINTEDAQRRLLCVSTAPSIPTTATSTSFSIRTPPLHGQRLASLVNSEEFDDLDLYSTRVGNDNIEREMEMVGLTENPWRGPSMNTDEAYEAAMARHGESRVRSAASEEARVVSADSDPFRDSKASTTPRDPSYDDGITEPPAAVVPPPSRTVNQHFNNDSPQISFAARIAAPNSTAPEIMHHSPNPSPPTTPPVHTTTGTSTQLAFHALSTPFHHSLQPHCHSHHVRTIDSVLHSTSIAEEAPRPRSAPNGRSQGPGRRQAHPTITHLPVGSRAPEAPDDFALGASPTSLFSCVWLRWTCPGLDARTGPTADADADASLSGDSSDGPGARELARGNADAGAVASTDARGKAGGACGKVAGWSVKSCLCSGTVQLADGYRRGQQAYEMGNAYGLGKDNVNAKSKGTEKVNLDAECRSGAPVVRYVVGKRLCERCSADKKVVDDVGRDES
ncbi:uncharacterized protein HMPREF1541_07027 [Cyphellophora europaea CBS 101466]|uniref:Uncharacterized protein n=1 Tax=Cyphellophora europaea (strain CBS 101466) TaxID=1220924 RepID=W2RRP3_CYPE1|nr:uncharacterized protein HMPREF1541_07027 [Cyphellophora europaea CBS 101466]ETN38985.1 hypothetical protein HMPREF1541_07027 [Cyphellophora europaea CBS 101466]